MFQLGFSNILALSAGDVLGLIFGCMVLMALMVPFSTSARKNQALMAPCIVLLTLAITLLLVGALTVAVYPYMQ